MHSERYKFIYLHVPKTGGNSITHRLLPVCDNQIYTEAHHDGVNRFGVQSPMSRDKHANLSVYAGYLGERFADYRILISVRHPFPRALSYYFSPNHWMTQEVDGRWVCHEPVWVEERFLAMVGADRPKPALSYLDLTPRPASPFVIRTEFLNRDFDQAISGLGIPANKLATLSHVNKTVATNVMLDRLLVSTELRNTVEAQYADDMKTFGYDSYVHQN